MLSLGTKSEEQVQMILIVDSFKFRKLMVFHRRRSAIVLAENVEETTWYVLLDVEFNNSRKQAMWNFYVQR